MKKLITIILSLALVLSLAACGKADSVVTAAKDKEGLDSGSVLSAKDADSLLRELEAAEKADGWMEGTVSNSIASCYLRIEKDGETMLYRYSEAGTLDDVENMRSLKLSEAAVEAMSGILSGYVDLSLTPMRVPDLGLADIQLKP